MTREEELSGRIRELEEALALEKEKRRELREILCKERKAVVEQRYTMVENSLKLLELKESLEEEQAKSARLLRNILPERVIAELRAEGRSKPERFENVTVFFSDIVDFTRLSALMEPEEVIAELSDLFSAFDKIFTANSCERIKTIGDAYMSVSGMPVPTPDHCGNILKSALEAMRYLAERNNSVGHPVWRMRFGIHSGPVVGGIVGTEKYIYDVFGDTVNTAARMEQLSAPMRINVSETARKFAPPDYLFTQRPTSEVKGKGRMKMFFLEMV